MNTVGQKCLDNCLEKERFKTFGSFHAVMRYKCCPFDFKYCHDRLISEDEN